MGWIRVAQNWHQLRAKVTTVTCLQVALKDEHFLTTSFSVPFSSTTRMSDRGSKYCPTYTAVQGQRNCAGTPYSPMKSMRLELTHKCICTCAHPLSIQAVNLSEEWKKKVSPPVILLKKRVLGREGMRYDGESCVMISGTGSVQQIAFGRENQLNDIVTCMAGKHTHTVFGVKT